MYVVAPLSIYIIDRGLRLLREKGSSLAISRDSATIIGSDMVCLRIPRTFSYLAGQYCDIKVPLVSNLEWHPFTIASSPHESDMLFYIKVNGDWTRNLYALFKERDGDHQDINIHVRGPYGAPAQHVGQYDHVVLISGGVGATPMASITKYAHNWILNFTERGAAASNSVSAAFTRNQSVRGTPSVPGTPTRNTSSGYTSGFASTGQSRHLSRNQSGNWNLSRNISRNFSRSGSRSGSRPLSRSGSRPLSRSGSRPLSRSGSGRLERFNSRGISRAESGALDRFNSGYIAERTGLVTTIDRNVSTQTNDSIGIIIQEQRKHQPLGPDEKFDIPSGKPDAIALDLGGLEERDSDEAVFSQFLEDSDGDMYAKPDDYEEELGNPDAPVPDRRAQSSQASPTVLHPPTFEIVKEYDSSKGLFDDDEEEEEEVRVSSRQSGHALFHETFDVDDMEMQRSGLELEDQILREQQTASNAYNMLGMSFGPMAMMRHMEAMDAKKLRSSLVRASMDIENGMDNAPWEERALFYLHTVTINWVLLWVMLLRFAIVCIGSTTMAFSLHQEGLGVFSMVAWNAVDLALGLAVSIPVIGAIVLEIYMHGLQEFVVDGIGNSFDLFVMSPLLVLCLVLHVLNLVGIGVTMVHVSKLTVLMVWPVLGWCLLWRTGRTIGSRITLAQYLKSSHAQTKSLDYIWVSKSHNDDLWLIRELLPLAGSNIVRLHRFITRHGHVTEPWMLDYEKVPLKTTYSRPDWDDVFSKVVERSKSGSVVGVFFCGPDSMARMIQQAAMKAMAKSVDNAYQRGYLVKRLKNEDLSSGRGGYSDRAVSSGRRTSTSRLGQAADNLRDPAAYGCSVRIAVRIENFT